MPPKPIVKSIDGSRNEATWEGGNDHKLVNEDHELMGQIFVEKVAELTKHMTTMVQRDFVFPARNGSDSIEKQIEVRKMLGQCLDCLSAVAMAVKYQIDNKDTLFTDARKERGMTRVQTVHDKAKLEQIRNAGGFKKPEPPPVKPEPAKVEPAKDDSKRSARFAHIFDDSNK